MCCATCPLNGSPVGLTVGLNLGPRFDRETLPCAAPRCLRATASRTSVLAEGAPTPRCHGRPDFPTSEPAEEPLCPDCPHRQSLDVCPQDLHVLATIASHDEFALATVHHTLDTLVVTGRGSDLCELFVAAPAEVRVDLWKRLTACHPLSLHLLNELFERAELPPLEPGQWPQPLASYRAAAEGRPATIFPWPSQRSLCPSCLLSR